MLASLHTTKRTTTQPRLIQEPFGSVWTLPLSELQQILKKNKPKNKNKKAKSAEFEGELIQIDAMKVTPLCLCVVRRGGKGCCLRWCAFVQSCTVSVLLHPWFGLGALEPTSAVQWMERQSLFLCLLSEVSSLLGTEGSQLLFKSQPSATPTRFTHPCLPTPFFSSLSSSCRLPMCECIFLSYKPTLNLSSHPNNIFFQIS